MKDERSRFIELTNELREIDKMRGLQNILSLFRSKFMMFYNNVTTVEHEFIV